MRNMICCHLLRTRTERETMKRYLLIFLVLINELASLKIMFCADLVTNKLGVLGSILGAISLLLIYGESCESKYDL